jgi:dTMP kinase
MADRRGRFITLEGGEGAGKSTQAARLAEWLRGRGLEAVQTREPGGTDGAEQIRGLLVSGAADRWTPLTETLLHYAARADHVARLIRPALARGAWVVCDRFADSTRAYQGAGQGMDAAALDAIHRAVLGDFAPDLTLVFDISPEAGLARAAARGGEARYESMPADFHARLRAAFLEIADSEPARCAVIDADQEPDAVERAMREIVRARLTLD